MFSLEDILWWQRSCDSTHMIKRSIQRLQKKRVSVSPLFSTAILPKGSLSCFLQLIVIIIFYQVYNCVYIKTHQHIKKQRHCFVNKGPSSQGYGLSSGHVWMWELDYKESWVKKKKKRKLSTEELMLLKCGVGEESWESLGLQGDPTSPS